MTGSEGTFSERDVRTAAFCLLPFGSVPKSELLLGLESLPERELLLGLSVSFPESELCRPFRLSNEDTLLI